MSAPENTTNTLDPETSAQLEKLRLEVEDLKWKLTRKYRYVQLTAGLLAFVAIGGLVLNFFVFNWQQGTNAERDRTAHVREFRKPVWDRQLALYYELTEVMATIATSTENDEDRQRAQKRFSVLYAGPSTFVKGKVEDSEHQHSLLSMVEIVDPGSLAAKLKNGSDPISQYLKKKLSSQMQQELDRDEDMSKFWRESLRKGLAEDLNQILTDPLLSEQMDQAKLSWDVRNLRAQKPTVGELIHLNRLVLEEAYPLEIGIDLRDDLIAFKRCLDGKDPECPDEESKNDKLPQLAELFAYKCRVLIGSIWQIKFSDSVDTSTQMLD